MKREWKRMAAIGMTVVALAVAGCARKSGGEHFGEPFTDALRVTLAQLTESPESFSRKAVRVTGTIERQCPVSGCSDIRLRNGGHL